MMRWNKTATVHSDKLGVLFILVPKAASTSIIRAVFDVEGIKSSRVNPAALHRDRRKRQISVEEAKRRGYMVVGAVRNPWDRIHSVWFNKIKMPGAASELRRQAGSVSFPKFISYIERVGPHSDGHTARQVDFLLNEDGSERYDVLLRYESLFVEWQWLQGELLPGLPDLPRLNVVGGSYKDAYDTELAQRVLDLYMADVVKFGHAHRQDSKGETR